MKYSLLAVLGLFYFSQSQASVLLNKEALLADLQKSVSDSYDVPAKAPLISMETNFQEGLGLTASLVEAALVEYSYLIETRLNKDCLPYKKLIAGRLESTTAGEIVALTQTLCQ